ncbi:hypothetical protein BaRGS_00004150, partial [Batillaria attramentaria]
DDEPRARLVIPEHLILFVVRQYHDENGHMGIDKTYDTIQQKYFWTDMYRGLYEYVSGCVVCQARVMQKQKAPVQEMDVPPYPFAKCCRLTTSCDHEESIWAKINIGLHSKISTKYSRRENMKTAAVLLCLCIGLVEGSLGSRNVVFR